MKFLLDMPVSASLLGVIREYGHEGVHASQIGKAFAPDIELLELARSENRIIVTADLDFPRLLALSMAEGPGTILFRGGNFSDTEMCTLLDRVLKKVSPEDLQNSISVVDPKRIRITGLPIRKK
jgi:predicted nuclease of predicted toxin-antitoxin system